MPSLHTLTSLIPTAVRQKFHEMRQRSIHGKNRYKHVKYVAEKYLPPRLQKIRNIVAPEFLEAYVELFEDFDPLGHTDRPAHTVHWPGYPHPLTLRKHSSDIPTFCQVFVDEQYEPAISQVSDQGTILDCGANIGLSAAWFLWKLKPRLVLALEPEPSNLTVCSQNLAPWGDMTKVVQGGLWHTGGLSLEIVDPGKLEWSFQCRGASKVNTTGPRTYTISQLAELASTSNIDLLKVDIEGAEADVFGVNWDHRNLSMIDNIAIEFHGPACEEAFRHALRDQSFRELEIGDTTWIMDLSVSARLRKTG